jgi:hypothetical protein
MPPAGASAPGGAALPPAIDPGEAEQTVTGAASVRTKTSGPRIVAAPVSARSPEGGSMAYGRSEAALVTAGPIHCALALEVAQTATPEEKP